MKYHNLTWRFYGTIKFWLLRFIFFIEKFFHIWSSSMKKVLLLMLHWFHSSQTYKELMKKIWRLSGSTLSFCFIQQRNIQFWKIRIDISEPHRSYLSHHLRIVSRSQVWITSDSLALSSLDYVGLTQTSTTIFSYRLFIQLHSIHF